MSKFFLILIASLLLGACAVVKNSPKYQISDEPYLFRQDGSEYQKVRVYVKDDSVYIFPKSKPNELLIPQPGKDQFFLAQSFDVDVLTIPFKYRPSSLGFPRQLDTDFNGNIFLGYRLDHFRLGFSKTPVGIKKSLHHRAVSLGVFGGLGSATISPSTTYYKIPDEYNGFVLSRGLAIMVGVNNLTFGLGVGWDYLTDRDQAVWIYQNKNWYGLTIGLNLN